MTDTNTGPRPPVGTLPGTLHWLSGAAFPCAWNNNTWCMANTFRIIPEDVSKAWTYLGPAIPPSDAPIPDAVTEAEWLRRMLRWRAHRLKDPYIRTLNQMLAAGPTDGDPNEPKLVQSVPAPTDLGAVPERETAWLVERKVTPPQYVTDRSEFPAFSGDPWRALRFTTEREAWDFRLRLRTMRDECHVIEHLFINKPDTASSPAPIPETDEPGENAAARGIACPHGTIGYCPKCWAEATRSCPHGRQPDFCPECLQEKLDAEIERVMLMGDEELRAELVSDGLDPDAEIQRMRRFTNRILRANQIGYEDGVRAALARLHLVFGDPVLDDGYNAAATDGLSALGAMMKDLAGGTK